MEQYDKILSDQNYVCAICHKPERIYKNLCVDHCHNSKKVRGLLCSRCNIGLSWFNDDIKLLQNAAEYL